jgi:hypothetical protein
MHDPLILLPARAGMNFRSLPDALTLIAARAVVDPRNIGQHSFQMGSQAAPQWRQRDG